MHDQTTLGPTEVLKRLRELLATRETIPSLEGSAYLRGHVAFESSSEQQGRILEWLLQHLRTAPGARLSVASIGAGSGILDVPLLARLAPERALDYLVLEPIAEQCAAFEERARRELPSDNPRLEIVQGTLASLDPARDFDRVLAIHSVYYFPDLEDSLAKLMSLVAPGGEAVVAVAPREEMNRLAEVFWLPQTTGPIWFEEDVLRVAEKLGLEAVRERIDAELVFDLGAESATDVESFLVQCDLAQLDATERELMADYLRQVGEQRDAGLAVSHPVSMLRFPR